MNKSGADTKIFKPRGCRSASTSAATNASTFYKYYFKEIENTKTFSDGLLVK